MLCCLGAFLEKFSTSSLSNDCACIGVLEFHRKWRWGHLFYTIEAQPWRAKKRPGFASGLWWNYRKRRESFCQHSQQGEDCVCFSYSSPSFGLCHQCFKSRRSEQVELQRKCWSVNILIHCLIFSWEFTIYLSLHKTSWKGKMILTDYYRSGLHSQSKIHTFILCALRLLK